MAFGLLFYNLRHLRGNELPSPIPFNENAQVAESSTNSIPLYSIRVAEGDADVHEVERRRVRSTYEFIKGNRNHYTAAGSGKRANVPRSSSLC